MKLFPLLLVLVSALFISCERHEFEETRKLHEHHGNSHEEHASAEGAHGEGAPKSHESAH